MRALIEVGYLGMQTLVEVDFLRYLSVKLLAEVNCLLVRRKIGCRDLLGTMNAGNLAKYAHGGECQTAGGLVEVSYLQVPC